MGHVPAWERSSPEWDLDSDEIASVTSQDLHDHRPNRWTGPQSSWRRLTEEERQLWRSMKVLEEQDLAVHLYNAFALKRRGRDPETAQDVTVTMENGQQGIWAPPKVWTAWPLNETRVPRQEVPEEEDDDADPFTIRKKEIRMPSSGLQEELTATILRLAKDRFHKRRKAVLASIEEDVSSREKEASDREGRGTSVSLDSSPPASSDDDESGQESERMAVDEEEDEGEEDGDENKPQSRRKGPTAPKTYDPTISADDELSYRLLRPSVRHILSRLDTTLTILHNARIATADYASDSSATDEESEGQSGPKRGRGRPRGSQAGGMSSPPQPGSVTPATASRRRGRPKKVHIPREGETHEEMLVRIARESHRRLPAMSQDRDAAFEEWLRKGDEKIAHEQALQREEEELGIRPGASVQERRMRRLGLRDWSDVVGAAALAGFSGEVISRTAKRCANLFGEGMVVRRLHEAPAARDLAFQSVEYRPEKIHPTDLEDDDDDDDDDDADDESDDGTAISSRHTTSRQPSAIPFSRDASFEPRRGRSSPHSPLPFSVPQPKSRSQSRSSVGFFLCPIPSCERSVTGFSRRQNLKRHMQLVHPGQEDEEEGDSEDEVLGAVHVDGFLKPIFPTRGWRENPTPNLLVRKRAASSEGRETSVDEGDSSS